MSGNLYPIDPWRLKIASKFLDDDYAAKTLVVPATREIRRPLPGRVWHDGASKHPVERSFADHEIAFGDTVARSIENPLLAGEMVLYDQSHLYVDTSIELEYSSDQTGSVAERLRAKLAQSADAPLDERFRDDTVLISHHEGGSTWGHYLCQSLPRILLFLEAFPSAKVAVPVWHADGALGFGEALALYGVPRERLAAVHPDMIYRFRRAILMDFLFNFQVAAPHPLVMPLLRRFAAPTAAFPHDRAAIDRRRAAFIKRWPDANRAIGNAEEVNHLMRRREIAIYGPGEISLAEQIDLWQRHDLVIATLGSDLSNMVFARPGTRVLVLAPHWFGDAFFFELAVAAGIQWYEIRCGEMAERNHALEHHSSFNVDAVLLESILATLLD